MKIVTIENRADCCGKLYFLTQLINNNSDVGLLSTTLADDVFFSVQVIAIMFSFMLSVLSSERKQA